MAGKPRDELRDSIRIHGQKDPLVFDHGILLDGRSRLDVLNELELEPWIVEFADLRTGLDPDDWIIIKNLQRRHLTDDQRLAITARYQDYREQKAIRQQTRGHAEDPAQPDQDKSTAGNEQSEDTNVSGVSEFRQVSAEIQPTRKRGRPPGERSKSKALAEQANQTRYRAEQIRKLRQMSPELATAVEEGRLSLKKAVERLRESQPSKSRAESPKAQVKFDLKKSWTRLASYLQRQREAWPPEHRRYLSRRMAELVRSWESR
jgi:hypothetical protein